MDEKTLQYFRNLSSQLVKEVSPPTEIKKFVDNSDILGAYIECAVRQFIRKIIYSGKINTGGIISPEFPKATNQIDTIIWATSPFPAIFEHENFAIVPKRSVFGIIEIKSSNYAGAVDKIKDSILSSKKLLIEERQENAIGIFCLKLQNQERLSDLVDNKKCFVLFDQNNDGTLEPNTCGIISFIQFLIRLEYDMRTGKNFQEPSDELIKALKKFKTKSNGKL